MNKNRLILTFYIGAISLSVATLSMSVAWYASSTRLRLETFEITIACDRQLAISTKPDDGYVASLDNDDLIDCGLFTPVTSGYQSKWLKNKADMPVFYDDTVYTELDINSSTLEAQSGYFSQKLYLLSDDDVYVTIDPKNTYFHAKEDYNKIYAETLYTSYQIGQDESLKSLSKQDIEDRLNHLVNAMRYSILVTNKDEYDYVIIDPNKTTDTYYGGLLDNNVDRYYDYYTKISDGSNYEKLYGEYNDRNLIVYDEPLNNDSDYLNVNEEPNAFNARHKGGIKRLNLEKSLENGLEIEMEKSLAVQEFEAEEKPFHFAVYKDKPQEIVLSIYIEGWDLDSINYTMGATFDANLELMIEREK